MKSKLFIFFAIVVCITFSSCTNFDFMNLKRDNPMDEKNDEVMKDGVAIKVDDYYIYSGGDSTVIYSDTEVALNVCLKNVGKNTAKGIKATFSTESAYVSDFDPSTPVNYYDINSGESMWYGYSQYYSWAFKFVVSRNTPAYTVIPISVDIKDENGNTWASTINLIVE